MFYDFYKFLYGFFHIFMVFYDTFYEFIALFLNVVICWPINHFNALLLYYIYLYYFIGRFLGLNIIHVDRFLIAFKLFLGIRWFLLRQEVMVAYFISENGLVKHLHIFRVVYGLFLFTLSYLLFSLPLLGLYLDHFNFWFLSDDLLVDWGIEARKRLT